MRLFLAVCCYPKTKSSLDCIYISQNSEFDIEMFYLNTIEQLFHLVEQLDQLEVCLPYSRLIAGIPILAEFQNLRLNSNKTSLCISFLELCHQTIHVSQLRQLNSKITWPLKTSRKRPVKILRCVLKFVIGVSVKSNWVTF